MFKPFLSVARPVWIRPVRVYSCEESGARERSKHRAKRGLPHHNQTVTVNPRREPTAMRVRHRSRAPFGLIVCFFIVAVRCIAEAGGLSVSMVTPHGGRRGRGGGERLKVIC